MPRYRSQNVRVLGISVDDPEDTAEWAREVGITFPLLADKNGTVAKRFGLFNQQTRRAARAVTVVHDGRVVYSQRVDTTEVPARILPWTAGLT